MSGGSGLREFAAQREAAASDQGGVKLSFYAALAVYGAMIPPVGLAVWMWAHTGGMASHVLAVYTAVGLSFIGGVHWGGALAGLTDSRRYLWAMVPLVVGWVLASLPWTAFSLPLLAAFVIALWYAERRWFAAHLPRWHQVLCMQLAFVSALALVAAWIAVLVHAR